RTEPDADTCECSWIGTSSGKPGRGSEFACVSRLDHDVGQSARAGGLPGDLIEVAAVLFAENDAAIGADEADFLDDVHGRVVQRMRESVAFRAVVEPPVFGLRFDQAIAGDRAVRPDDAGRRRTLSGRLRFGDRTYRLLADEGLAAAHGGFGT